MDKRSEINMALAIKLEDVIEEIRSEILDIYYAVEDGKTSKADAKLKRINSIITDFACGDVFDILGDDLDKARQNTGEKRRLSRLNNKQN